MFEKNSNTKLKREVRRQTDNNPTKSRTVKWEAKDVAKKNKDATGGVSSLCNSTMLVL